MKSTVHLIAITLLALSGSALADDGTVDFLPSPTGGINISQPGSYRLADNVTITSSVDAITVTADDVTIDLGGHTITGPGAVSPGPNAGIMQPSGSRMRVFNGTIRNYLTGIGDGVGIWAGAGAWIHDVRVDACSWGIVVGGDDTVVERSVVSNNGVIGIRVSSDRVAVRDCLLTSNSGAGIELDNSGYSLVTNNHTVGNDNGIFTNGGGGDIVITGNTVTNNLIFGINNGGDAHVFNNFASGNGVDYSSGSPLPVASLTASREWGDNLKP
jgi:parallel beta-helix repeat protein